MNTRYTRLAILSAALLLSACASKPEVVPSSGPRPPTSPDQVQIYQKEPKRYEKLGAVSVSRNEGASWDDRGDATAGFDILKRKAAALGANGLLLIAADEAANSKRITAGYHGNYYEIPVSRTTPPYGLAQAIYVLSEK
jgi:hypothetical protein